MISDGETVCFLLDGADESKYRLICIDRDLHSLGRHQCPGPVLVIFYHTKHRKRQIKCLQRLYGNPGVVDAAVNKQQIRRFRNPFVPGF